MKHWRIFAIAIAAMVLSGCCPSSFHSIGPKEIPVQRFGADGIAWIRYEGNQLILAALLEERTIATFQDGDVVDVSIPALNGETIEIHGDVCWGRIWYRPPANALPDPGW